MRCRKRRAKNSILFFPSLSFYLCKTRFGAAGSRGAAWVVFSHFCAVPLSVPPRPSLGARLPEAVRRAR